MPKLAEAVANPDGLLASVARLCGAGRPPGFVPTHRARGGDFVRVVGAAVQAITGEELVVYETRRAASLSALPRPAFDSVYAPIAG